jgi:hypothetical protein
MQGNAKMGGNPADTINVVVIPPESEGLYK